MSRALWIVALAALSLVAGCHSGAHTSATSSTLAPTRSAAPASSVAPAPTRAAAPLVEAIEVPWSAASDRRILLHAPAASYVDLIAAEPASAAHPQGTVIVATRAGALTGTGDAATLYEWDIAASRVVRAKQLPNDPRGSTQAVRAVRHGAELLVVSESTAEGAHTLRLTAFDASLRVVRDGWLEIGPLPSAPSVVADERHVIIAATVHAAPTAPSQRVVVFDASSWRPLAQADSYGVSVVDAIRPDALVLQEGRLFVLAHDPARTVARATSERPMSLGPLGVLAYEPSSMRKLAFGEAPESADAPASLFARASGVSVVNDGIVTDFDAALTRGKSRNVRSLGPYLARGARGALLRAPAARSLVPVPTDAMQESCIPAWTQHAMVYACSVWSDAEPGNLYVVSQKHAGSTQLTVSR